MSNNKCLHFDRGYCKFKDLCTKVHPNINFEGTCEDKRLCTKRHHILCKSGSSCEWTSCEFLRNTEKQDNEPAKTKEVENIVESMIEGRKRSVNNCIESMMQLLVRIEEENKNTCQ